MVRLCQTIGVGLDKPLGVFSRRYGARIQLERVCMWRGEVGRKVWSRSSRSYVRSAKNQIVADVMAASAQRVILE